MLAFKSVQRRPKRAAFLHIVTKKGKGFAPAEENPGEFHGVSAFDVNALSDPDITQENSFSTVFGECLTQLAHENDKICAITAAMKYGTGTQYFYRAHKERFFDVGMAEQHAVTFAAGLSACGMKPVVCIYSTFLQRAYDQIIHDVNLQNLDVLFAIDRAGLVPGDGETHQGIYDCAFLSQLSNMSVYSVCNYAEMRFWLKELTNITGPRAIRYQRGSESARLEKLGSTGKEYDVYCSYNGEYVCDSDDKMRSIKQVTVSTGKANEMSTSNSKRTAVVTYGGQADEVFAAVENIEIARNENNAQAEQNTEINVFKLVKVHPLPDGLIDELAEYDSVLFVEEGVKSGGIGEHVCCALKQKTSFKGTYKHIAADAQNLTHATVCEMKKLFGLDEESIRNLL